MDRLQINVRLPPDLMELLDRQRVELHATLGKIPSRSDVVRLALEFYLQNYGQHSRADVAQNQAPSLNRGSD